MPLGLRRPTRTWTPSSTTCAADGAGLRVIASSRFLRRAGKLKPPRDELLRAALRRFASDPQDPLLRPHKPKGDLADCWAFRVDDDLRVLFRWDGDTCFLVALGTHDEVY
jgi:mRNA-degrading endonuclease YafQ of YafQ-DinJ toxin-antitoxin module